MKRPRPAIQSFSGLLLAGAILFQVSLLPAQEIPIAVMDFDGFGISQVEAIALSNRLRNELFRLGTFDVVDRGMMENILTEQDFQMVGCTSNECLVEVGQLLGAKQMMGGSISKVGNTFSVSARLVDVETGRVLRVSDFDLRGELDDMLTRGMKRVAVMLSGDEGGAQEVATQQVSQPSQPGIPVRSALPKRPLWQLRIGRRSNGKEYYPVTFSYDLLNELNLWGIKLHPTISGGFLYGRWGELWIGEGGIYVMLEVHRKWSSAEGNFRASLYSGVGFNVYFLDYYDEFAEFFQAGAQARAKLLPILPTLVGDVGIIYTQISDRTGYGASYVVSFGVQGSFLQIASIWAAIALVSGG